MLAASGGQEKGYRRGTRMRRLRLASRPRCKSRAFADAMSGLEQLGTSWSIAFSKALCDRVGGESRMPAIGAYAMPGVASASQLVQFDLAGIAFPRAARVLRKHEAEPCAGSDGLPAEIGSRDPRQLRARRQRRISTASSAEWRRIRDRRRREQHDLPRLPGDDPRGS
jgi:hypothetical protein